ncbi:MAG: hypothetical protein RBS17_10685 [Coriobacteriia bacterium]|nr:hypothetical protein [Coriobacteriia bacterium]
MDKAQALARLGIEPTGLTRFANINSAKDVWWVDVPLSVLVDPEAESVDLALFDGRTSELHHLRVPVGFLNEHLGAFHVRDDVDKVSLELAIDPPDRFRNVVPVDSGVSLAPFLVRTI